jgi:hypothetical protein
VAVPYEKPHLNYEGQIAKLVGRGSEVPDTATAIEALKTIGYYRLSAYLHTFRPVGPNGGILRTWFNEESYSPPADPGPLDMKRAMPGHRMCKQAPGPIAVAQTVTNSRATPSSAPGTSL